MPLKCCITNRRSNDKAEEDEEAVSVFSFPGENKEGDLRQMDKTHQQEELGAYRIVQNLYQAFPNDVQTR